MGLVAYLVDQKASGEVLARSRDSNRKQGWDRVNLGRTAAPGLRRVRDSGSERILRRTSEGAWGSPPAGSCAQRSEIPLCPPHPPLH